MAGKGASAQTKTLGAATSHFLDETVHHLLLAGMVEIDGELVALDVGDIAVTELLVEDAVAGAEGRGGAGRLGDELALDGERAVAAGRSSCRLRARGSTK